MSRTVNDISLIKKYLAGELDAPAMHELERRALDDPFLADALEGYEHAGKDQQKNLADLTTRLQSRTDKKVRMLTPRRQLSIAASLLVIIGIGAWLVIRNQNVKHEEVKQVAANVSTPSKPKQPTVSAPSQLTPQSAGATVKKSSGSVVTRYPAPIVGSEADAATSQPPAVHELSVKADSAFAASKSTTNAVAGSANKNEIGTADNKAPVVNYSLTDANKAAAPQYKASTGANDAIVQSLNANISKAKKPRSMVPETLLNAHEDNLDVQPASHGYYSTLVGHVTGNNQPVVGAVVKLSGADFGVVTDLNGRFVMHNVPDNKSLEVKSLGYASKQVKLNGRDSITISLDPNMSALAEVVTVAKPILNNNDDKSSGSAGIRPSAGWKTLNTYLNKNAVSPDGKTGKVMLSFVVNARGGLSGFTIVQSLDASADQKAIDLISNGPGWTGNSDGQPHQVTVTVSFH